jgi:hypothetical protein
MAIPLPDPLPPVHDEAFERLQADILEAYEEVKAGLSVPEEEVRAMFGIEKKWSCPVLVDR